MFRIVIITFFILIWSCMLFSQDYQGERVLITASRLYTDLVVDIRDSQILTAEDIKQLPVQSIAELIDYIGGSNTQTRGLNGVQTDFSIRGSSFEQVLVLIDGVRFNHPQTGHHNSDIPIPLSMVKRIEVLPGQGSSLYGSDSYGGIIHIITKDPRKGYSSAGVRYGSFNTGKIGGAHTVKTGSFHHLMAAEMSSSDGYTVQTQYNIMNANIRSRAYLFPLLFDFYAGWIKKDFGANGFYAPFPSHEITERHFGYIKFQLQINEKIYAQSRISYNNHSDFFILDIYQPGFYQNRHNTISIGMDSRINFCWSLKTETAVGFEVHHDNYTSEKIGNHAQNRFSFYVEQVFLPVSKITVNPGLRIDQQKQWGSVINPNCNLKWQITPSLIWRMTAGYSFRAPSFTELYNPSPANIGNPNLKPEKAKHVDGGILWKNNRIRLTGTLFTRWEEERIDWVAESVFEPWRAVNMAKLKISGVTFTGKIPVFPGMIYTGNFTQLYKYILKENDFVSKYALNIPAYCMRHSFIFSFKNEKYLDLTINHKYWNRNNQFMLVDFKLSIPKGGIQYSVSGKNIFNTEYEEIIGVPMPGRRFFVEIAFVKTKC